MRLSVALAILALLALPAMALEQPPRAEDVDIVPEFAYPEESGNYQTEKGIVFNLTLRNAGTTPANLTGSVQLEVKNDKGGLVWKPLSLYFKDVPAGGYFNMEYPKWSPVKGGKFQAKAYVTYFGDTNAQNNQATRNFSMYSDTWLEDPKLENGKVSPVYGNTGTDFTYRVKYTYNKLPDIVKVVIDGAERTMQEGDPEDLIAEDGKEYVLSTKLGIGDHRYRFYSIYDTNMTKYPNATINGPWVNLTLNTEAMSPTQGYVTTDFRFSVFYGSAKNLPPDEIVAVINNVTYPLTRYSLTPVYTTGQIEYYTRVKGYDLLMPPVNLTFKCRQGGDSLSLGPFDFKGPSIERGNLTGKVMDISGDPIHGARIVMLPGNDTTYSGTDGSYRIGLYRGPGYSASCSASGFMNKTYTNIDIISGEDTRVDFQLLLPPRGASISGSVSVDIDGTLTRVQGIRVWLKGAAYESSSITNETGQYRMDSIPGGEGYQLSVEGDPYVPFKAAFNIQEDQIIRRDIVLLEKDLALSISPSPGPIPLSVEFNLTFGSPVNITTVYVSLYPPVSTVVVLNTDMSSLRVIPEEGLWYATNYTLVLASGVKNMSGNLIVWKELSWSYTTPLQGLGSITTHPAADSTDVPLDAIIGLEFSIDIDEGSLDIALVASDNRTGQLIFNYSVEHRVNDSDHRRTSSIVTLVCDDLGYGKDYILTISDSLLDIYGRPLFDAPYNLEFTTINEPDTDGDGYPDSIDDFPQDPRYHSDRDKDGVADEADAFPDDANESLDTDGDGTGDNADPDDDGDGMPDEWELAYGLDPLDPQDAFADLDGDGHSNIDEYNADTLPNDRSDHPSEDIDSLWIWIVLAVVALLIFIAIAVLARFKGRSAPVEE